MVNICIIGASTAWTPTLAADLMYAIEDRIDFRFFDINRENSKLCVQWGRAASKNLGRKDTFKAYTNRRMALKDADGVIITISTGGLDAMEQDVKIPEKYKIFASVGDTAGPGGWSRSVRNIGVFRSMAEDFESVCPSAFIANYTNPLSSLTATLSRCCSNPLNGFCHAYFEIKDVIQKIFNLKDWGPISISIAGMNHFTWVQDFKIGRQNGYELLRKKISGGSLADCLPAESADEIGIYSGHEFCVELYDAFGYLPYPADRHTSEFVSFVLAGDSVKRRMKKQKGEKVEIIDYCRVRRTSVDYRRRQMKIREKRLLDMTAGKENMPGKSRETGAEMVKAYLMNKPFVDAVNLPNRGQIPGLPEGACVETMGVADGMGVRPLAAGPLPEPLLELMRPQAVCQKWIVEAMLGHNKDLLIHALYRDPQCSHLKLHQVRAMAEELLAANRKFLKPCKINF